MLVGLIDKKLSSKGFEPLQLNYEFRVLTIKLQAIKDSLILKKEVID